MQWAYLLPYASALLLWGNSKPEEALNHHCKELVDSSKDVNHDDKAAPQCFVDNAELGIGVCTNRVLEEYDRKMSAGDVQGAERALWQGNQVYASLVEKEDTFTKTFKLNFTMGARLGEKWLPPVYVIDEFYDREELTDWFEGVKEQNEFDPGRIGDPVFRSQCEYVASCPMDTGASIDNHCQLRKESVLELPIPRGRTKDGDDAPEYIPMGLLDMIEELVGLEPAVYAEKAEMSFFTEGGFRSLYLDEDPCEAQMEGTMPCNHANRRMIAVSVYLNDVPIEHGGATHFHGIERHVQPALGRAVVYFPTLMDGTTNRFAARAESMLHKGVKGMFTMWFRHGDLFCRDTASSGGELHLPIHHEDRDGNDEQRVLVMASQRSADNKRCTEY